MAKKADVASSTPPILDEITVHGGEPGLPPGLMLAGPMRALVRPDGRLRLLGLPPTLDAQYYPGDALATPTVAPAASPAQASRPEES